MSIKYFFKLRTNFADIQICSKNTTLHGTLIKSCIEVIEVIIIKKITTFLKELVW